MIDDVIQLVAPVDVAVLVILAAEDAVVMSAAAVVGVVRRGVSVDRAHVREHAGVRLARARTAARELVQRLVAN